MTRDQFLDEFMAKSGMPKSARLPDGVKLRNFHRIAIECPDGPAEHNHHWQDGNGHQSAACPGWILIEPPKNAYRGGEYTVKTH